MLKYVKPVLQNWQGGDINYLLNLGHDQFIYTGYYFLATVTGVSSSMGFIPPGPWSGFRCQDPSLNSVPIEDETISMTLLMFCSLVPPLMLVSLCLKPKLANSYHACRCLCFRLFIPQTYLLEFFCKIINNTLHPLISK